MRLASILICLITIASFALFVNGQSSGASTHQQRLLNDELPAPGTPQGAAAPAPAKHESLPRRVIDDASNTLTSPFSGVTAGSSSEWVIHGTKLLLALAVYGFGLGFLVRFIRVRV
jgi:hypothetical protein